MLIEPVAGHRALSSTTSSSRASISGLPSASLAQFVFAARFLVQWIASEKAERSVMPVGFWFLSIGGGAHDPDLRPRPARSRDHPRPGLLDLHLHPQPDADRRGRHAPALPGSERRRRSPSRLRLTASRRSWPSRSGGLRVRLPEAREAGLEIGLEVVEILQPDVEAQRVAAGLPLGRRAVGARSRRGSTRLSKPPQE